MSRYLGIFALTVAIVLAALGLLWYATRPSQSPQQSSTNEQGGIFPGNTSGTSGSAQASPTKTVATQGAKAAYLQALAQEGNYDNVKAGTTVVAGNYALQNWKGDNTSGEALLKYAPTSGTWSVLDAGGGEWSVAGLMKFGMDKKTALILLSGIRTGK